MLSKIRNFRLQPILNLSYGSPSIISYEILVNLHNNEQDLEYFFTKLPLGDFKSLFFFQASLCCHLDGYFHINTPLELLLDHYISGLTSTSNFSNIESGRLKIEIQNPDQLFSLSPLDLADIITEIRMLQARGVQVWLDDINEAHYTIAMDLGVDGVKLDKSFFWSVDDLSSVQKKFLNENISVIVEGVESAAHYSKVAQFDYILVQGFLWPDIHIDLNGRISQ
ncbi:EAL domain-containing protein [Vibrio alginolyticus]|nr:EAL domain-containing protein [Vibrio alginolyticus]MDL0445800.1 EAL domain-containing protein [Vibrio alginolyticus]